MSSTVSNAEIAKFAKDSAHWWDECGPFAPLHRLNPERLRYIKDQICAHFVRDPDSLRSLSGLSILDVGCGGGLVCEPLARLGGRITGIDADSNAIAVAKTHAQESGLSIDYRARDVGTIKTRYDVVLALEILEHVENPAIFIDILAQRVKPRGLLILSTLNRTTQSCLLGIVAAEYILNWVPRGTHDWRKFITPAELARHVRAAGLVPSDICGLMFNLRAKRFALEKNAVNVNYFLCAQAPP